MTNKILEALRERFTLTQLEVGEFATLKASGMKFAVEAYKAEGLGHVSVMRAKGFCGLMKMDTLIINPTEIDLPLYSYDRIFAMGNDTLIVELYDTFLCEKEKVSYACMAELAKVKEAYASLPERDPGEHWYDDIKLAESISKKSKKPQIPDMDALAFEHFKAYLAAPAAKVESEQEQFDKNQKSAVYVNGLLGKGGPSTDVFLKAFGKEKTDKLFKEVLFGTWK